MSATDVTSQTWWLFSSRTSWASVQDAELLMSVMSCEEAIQSEAPACNLMMRLAEKMLRLRSEYVMLTQVLWLCRLSASCWYLLLCSPTSSNI